MKKFTLLKLLWLSLGLFSANGVLASDLQRRVERRPGKGSWRAHSMFAVTQIELVLSGGDRSLLITPVETPPGSPI